jgi:hypothetical protein
LFGPRMRCATCGHLGTSVRPHWLQRHGIPGGPTRSERLGAAMAAAFLFIMPIGFL